MFWVFIESALLKKKSVFVFAIQAIDGCKFFALLITIIGVLFLDLDLATVHYLINVYGFAQYNLLLGLAVIF